VAVQLATGRETRNEVPSPARLSTAMRPPDFRNPKASTQKRDYLPKKTSGDWLWIESTGGRRCTRRSLPRPWAGLGSMSAENEDRPRTRAPMPRRLLALTILGILIVCSTPVAARGTGGGQQVLPEGPRRATSLRGYFVTAYEECENPTQVFQGPFGNVGADACAPPVRSDPSCGFGPKGVGRFAFVRSSGGIKVAAKLTGLDEGCEGEFLWLAVTARATPDSCEPSPLPCTVVDRESRFLISPRFCIVRDGKCSTGAFLPWSEQEPGVRLELGVLDVRVERGVRLGEVRTFQAGIALPGGRR
jgi:hypothetical protein